MKTFDADAIYGLLPLTVRTLDAAAGGTLYALVEVIASQANIVDDNLYQLYDDCFIETCNTWAIPYIGELIGFRPLRSIPPSEGPARADVADTIELRRRKGTLAMLDWLGYDVTNWPTFAVEYFELLAVSQYVRNHVRLQDACVDVHGYETALDVNSAFDVATRSLDVRRIASDRGRYNVPNIGLFVWRLAAYGGATLQQSSSSSALPNKLVATTARNVGPNRFTFDPYGDDVALVNPVSAPELSDQGPSAPELTARSGVPYPLRRFPLYDELEGLRKATILPLGAVYFGKHPVLSVFDTGGAPIAPLHLKVCDLTQWQQPTDPQIYVAIDPELGRLVCNPAAFQALAPLRVAYAYAFSGNYGGGTYPHPPDDKEGGPTLVVEDLAGASPDGWHSGVVEIGDSGLYLKNVKLTPLVSGLVVRAADDARPVIVGDVTIVAVARGSITLRGIGITGKLSIAGNLAAGSSSTSSRSSSSAGSVAQAGDPTFAVTLEDCTLRGSLEWTYPGGGTLTVSHSLCAKILADPSIDLSLADSVIDAGSVPASDRGSSASSGASGGADPFAAIAGANGADACGNLSLSACTVFGDVNAREIGLIENSIVTGPVIAARTQAGCIRYSYLPTYSVVPPRFRCQPDLAIDTAVDAARAANPGLTTVQAAAIGATIAQSLVPVFTSRRKGDAGYAQLADACSTAISNGAESEDEMGAFHGLYSPRRESNFAFSLDEYLRVGLDAGIIHAS